jgi:hypothetical protein
VAEGARKQPLSAHTGQFAPAFLGAHSQVLAKRDRKTSNFPKIMAANRGAKNDFRLATISPITEKSLLAWQRR